MGNFNEARPLVLRPGRFRIARNNNIALFFIFNAVVIFWALEVLIAQGAYADLLAPYKISTLGSVFLFAVGANLGLLCNFSQVQIPRPKKFDFRAQRWSILLMLSGVAIVLILAPSQRLSYANVIRSEEGVGVLGIWGPLMVAGAMLFLASCDGAGKASWFAYGATLIVSFFPGGRTIPAILILLLVCHRFIYSRNPARVKPLVLLFALALATLSAWAMAYLGTIRGDGLGGSTWDPSSLERYGYGSAIPGMGALLANLGVIGESALIVRSTTPEVVPYLPLWTLVTDLLSFIPGVDGTFDARSIDTWAFFGASIETSRPGGLHTTFYMMGGSTCVLLLSFFYAVATKWCLARAKGGSVIAFGVSILFLVALIVGAYGVGWPTGMLFLSLFIYSLARFAAGIACWLEMRVRT